MLEIKIMINTATVAGYVGKNPELKTFSNGNYKVTFSVAINKGKEEKDGVVWIPVEVWGNIASFINNYVHSGDFIVVEGRLESSRWEDAEGNKRSRLFLVGDKVESPKSLSKNGNNNGNLKATSVEVVTEAKDGIPF